MSVAFVLNEAKKLQSLYGELCKLVYGYIRDNQCHSEIVYYLTFLYYVEEDEWDQEGRFGVKFDECFAIDSHNYKVLKKITEGNESAFLKKKVSGSGVHKWKFRIDHFSQPKMKKWKYVIGVWKPNKYNGQYSWIASSKKQTNYFVHSMDNLLSSKRVVYSDDISKDTVVEMILDLNNFTICWIKNGINYPIVYDNIEDCEYQAFVKISRKNSTIRLLSFDSTA